MKTMNRKFTAEEIEYQRKQMEQVEKLGGITDYNNEYSMYRYMLDGEIPQRNDYGQEIDQEIAKEYVEQEIANIEMLDDYDAAMLKAM